jgi:mannosyltransferase OCH1-like enzyme
MHQSYKNSNPQTWHHGWEYHRQTWMDLHPHWFYIFWSDIHNELLAKCIGYADILRGRSGIQKADLSRLMYLHKYGGFYSDMDYIALQNHQQLFDREDNNHDLKHQIILLQGRQEQVVGFEWGFARQPEHPLWKFCLDIANRQKNNVRTQCPIFFTGPKFLGRCLKQYFNLRGQGKELEHMVSYGNELMILEPKLIAPIGANDFDSECGKWRSIGEVEEKDEEVWTGKWPTSACRQNLIKNGTYAVTIYTHSWGKGLKC